MSLMPKLSESYVPDLTVMDDQEIDAYLRPILAAQHTADAAATKAQAKAEAAEDAGTREAYLDQARRNAGASLSYAVQAAPYLAELKRRGNPKRRTMTRAQFLATAPRDLVVFPEGRAPYVLVDKPKGMSQKAYDAHIDRAGKVILVMRLVEDDGRRFERLTADAQSARAFWVSNAEYNHQWPERDHREVYLSARWAD